MAILISLLTGILLILSVGLIGIIAMQTPKNEGFTGGVANTPSSNFRGKAGYEETLSQYTRNLAVGWFATAFIIYILNEIKG